MTATSRGDNFNQAVSQERKERRRLSEEMLNGSVPSSH